MPSTSYETNKPTRFRFTSVPLLVMMDFILTGKTPPHLFSYLHIVIAIPASKIKSFLFEITHIYGQHHQLVYYS